MAGKRVGLADNWLRHVQDVFHKHADLLPASMADEQRHNRLCELNVIEQVVNVCQTTIAQDAWERGQDLTIHGWVYSLDDGLVRDLGMSVSAADELVPQLRASLAQYRR
jgi:carbonic anhydrase